MSDKQVPTSPSTATYDAQSGFHDIKPLPLFSPFPFSALFIALAILLAAIGLYLFSRYRRRQTCFPQVSIEAPLPQALKAIAALQNAKISEEVHLRHFALELSFILRRYIERVFHFPALESTSHELSVNFFVQLKKRCPEQELNAFSSYGESLHSILSSCDVLSFSPNPTWRLSMQGDQFKELIPRSTSFLQEIDRELREQEARDSSMLAKEAAAHAL